MSRTYIFHIFFRKKKNFSGSISVQIISKTSGKYRVLKTAGCGCTEQEIEKLSLLAKQEIGKLSKQSSLFVSETDTIVDCIFSSLSNAGIRTVGPELVFGKIYDKIGFGAVKENLFYGLIYKEPERILYKEKSSLSLKTSAELTHTMYEITYTLSESRHIKSQLLKMDEKQNELFNIINKNFQVVATMKTGGLLISTLQ